MRYANLHELWRGSASSRKFFLSQSVEMQLKLCERADFIHTAAELHAAVEAIARYERAVEISRMLF